MSCRARQKSLRLPHLALMLLLAVGLVAQSVVDLTGQTHEALLHANADETYTHHHDLAGHDTAHANETGDESDDTLHLLMHQPCGGHCVWIAGTSVAPAVGDMLSTAAAADTSAPRPSSDYSAPFRPPISV